MFGLKKRREVEEPGAIPVSVAVVAEPMPEVVPVRPFPGKPPRSALTPELSEEAYAEYSAMADSVGFKTPALLIERFKLFLVKHDLPVYELKTVVEYMDALAERDNPTGYGWSWKPLRAIDGETSVSFGRPSSAEMYRFMGDMNREQVAASDYFATAHYGMGGSYRVAPYGSVVPLHALKRVALVDAEFGAGTVVFAVSDYQTEPHTPPDPFLIAMIPNPGLRDGIGRFVIDVWDEPGFGIERMLK